MNNKIVLRYLSVIIFVGIIAFSAYRAYKGSDAPKEQYIFEEQQPAEETPVEEQPVETQKEYIILTRVTYKGLYRTTIRLYSTGKLEQSTIKEETTIESKENERFINIGTVNDEELSTIKNTIDKMSKESFKQSDFSDSYGLSIRFKIDGVFYSAEYFAQEDVNTIYNIINKY